MYFLRLLCSMRLRRCSGIMTRGMGLRTLLCIRCLTATSLLSVAGSCQDILGLSILRDAFWVRINLFIFIQYYSHAYILVFVLL